MPGRILDRLLCKRPVRFASIVGIRARQKVCREGAGVVDLAVMKWGVADAGRVSLRVGTDIVQEVITSSYSHLQVAIILELCKGVKKRVADQRYPHDCRHAFGQIEIPSRLAIEMIAQHAPD